MSHTGEIDQWISEVRAVSARVQTLMAASTAVQRCVQPNAQAWSVDQVLEHIMQVNSSVVNVIREIQNGTYKAGIMSRFPWIARKLGALILRSVQPQTQSKIKTVAGWEPQSSGQRHDMADMFQQHQEELCAVLHSMRTMPLHAIIISSPENSLIVYTLYAALQIIVAHEQRHCNQAERTIEMVRAGT